jgi:hypothetical protein
MSDRELEYASRLEGQLAEARAEVERLFLKLRAEEERHAALAVRCYEGFPSISDGIFDALKEAEAKLAEARAALDRADCTHREGGDARHCPPDRMCWRCRAEQAEAALARVVEAAKDAKADLEDAEAWACAIEARDQRQADMRGNAFRSVHSAKVRLVVAFAAAQPASPALHGTSPEQDWDPVWGPPIGREGKS